MTFPIIESPRIILRELNDRDVTLLFDIYSNQDAMQYWDSDVHSDLSETNTMLQKMQTSWHSNEGISWAIELKKSILNNSGKLIGQITIHNWHKKNQIAKLGYIINPLFWGQGFGSETLKSVINFGFSELRLKNIIAEVDPENNASATILQKNGFQYLETKKDDLMKNGVYYDAKVYQLCVTKN